MDEYEKAKEIQRVLNLAYFYLKFRPRTYSELHTYLMRKAVKFGWIKESVDAALVALAEERLINDFEFVKWYVEQRNLLKPKSEFALRQELLKKGVPKEIMDDYFSKYQVEEEPLAYQALHKRFYRWENLEKQKRFQKAASFLARRGFSFDVIKKTVARLEEKG